MHERIAFCPSAAIPKANAREPYQPRKRQQLQMRSQPRRPKRLNAIPLTALSLYAGRLFILPPFEVNAGQALTDALKLSLNFGYVTPFVLPTVAPVMHPVLEAIFHAVVAWAVLLLAFSSLAVTRPRDRPTITPFLIGSLFLTNLIYLPYLVLRNAATPKAPEHADKLSYPLDERTPFIDFTESSWLPITAVTLLGVSLPWALFARPHFGDIITRFHTFATTVLHGDILAYSFCLDLLVFACFQSTLVGDDSRTRSWSSEHVRERAVTAARWLPFFGLAFYLLQRAVHAPLQWHESD